MARTNSKTTKKAEKAPEIETQNEKTTEVDSQAEIKADVETEVDASEMKIPENVLRLMKLYPQYDEFYVTDNGFLHPKGAPFFLIENAILYKNKFFKK